MSPYVYGNSKDTSPFINLSDISCVIIASKFAEIVALPSMHESIQARHPLSYLSSDNPLGKRSIGPNASASRRGGGKCFPQPNLVRSPHERSPHERRPLCDRQLQIVLHTPMQQCRSSPFCSPLTEPWCYNVQHRGISLFSHRPLIANTDMTTKIFIHNADC
jgi:hypothetical protein